MPAVGKEENTGVVRFGRSFSYLAARSDEIGRETEDVNLFRVFGKWTCGKFQILSLGHMYGDFYGADGWSISAANM